MSTVPTPTAPVKTAPQTRSRAEKEKPAPPPPLPDLTGFLAAFRTGDVVGTRAAADMLRDHNRPEDAHAFDVLAFELEACCAQARQVRFVLDSIAKPTRVTSRKVPPWHVDRFLEQAGLPVSLKGSQEHFVIVVPNDGQHEDTVDRLASLLDTAFPQAEFFVVLDNYPRTDLGVHAVTMLYKFKSRAGAGG